MSKKETNIGSVPHTLQTNITWLAAKNSNKNADIANAVGLSTMTWRNRISDPDSITVGELCTLAEMWGVTPAQLLTVPKFDDTEELERNINEN